MLPLLGALALDSELNGRIPLDALPPEIKDYGVDKAAVQRAMDAVPRSEVARKLAQVCGGGEVWGRCEEC